MGSMQIKEIAMQAIQQTVAAGGNAEFYGAILMYVHEAIVRTERDKQGFAENLQ